MAASLLSNLLTNAKRNLYSQLVPLPSPGSKLDEFTVVSTINQAYGVYGYSTAIAAISAKGHLIIVFRGSNDLSDFLTDIEATLEEPWPEIDPTGTLQFADGFIDVFREIFVPWLTTFQSTIRKAKHVTVVGHSLGAAFANLAGMWLAVKGIKPEVYTYGTPIFGNEAAKERMERLGIKIYDVAVENDPVPALFVPWSVRIGNGPTGPQRNFILKGPFDEPTLFIPPNSVIPWFPNPASVSRHFLTNYIIMLENLNLAQKGGVTCTYNASALRNDPFRKCANSSTQCIHGGKLVSCGAEGWCGTNGTCVTKHQPYNCSSATDCNVGAMCVSPGYHLPNTTWDSITEPCRQDATCSRSLYDFNTYCWNK